MLCFHNFAVILTARIRSSVTTDHKGKTAKSALKLFY